MSDENDPKKKINLPLHLRKAFTDADNSSHLFDAILKGDAAKVKDILSQHPDALQWRHNGYTPLGYACMSRKGSVSVPVLLAAGCDIEEKSVNSWPPLLIAAFHDRPDVIIQLLEAGADIEGKDKYGFTPLLFAVQKGHAACVDLLILCGAKTDARNIFGEGITALIEKTGHNKMAEVISDARRRLNEDQGIPPPVPATDKDIPVFKERIKIKKHGSNDIPS